MCSLWGFAFGQNPQGSVRNLGNGDVTFSILAPQAKEVKLGGDASYQPHEFVKGADGVWTATLHGIKDGVYRYNFVVDGVQVQDPQAPLSPETAALATVSDGKQFFDMRQDIPHGTIGQRHYYSRELKQMRRFHIWTPTGYENSSDRLPVLYLIHGGGDNDAAWPGVGCAGNILDNLMAEGKMKPMIVVMPNGSIPTDKLEDEVPMFTNDLVTDIIPLVEKNYRVKTGSAHRAIAGLSMGGMETLDALLRHQDLFDYFWVLSSGWWYDKQTYADYQRQINAIAPKLGHVKQLQFTMGGPEDIAYKNCKQMLKLFDKAGIKYHYSEMPGGHSWYVWRHNLHDLAQKIFK